MSAQLVVQLRDGRYHFRFRASENDVWQEIKEDFKAQFDPRDERRYDADEKAWSVPAWCRARQGGATVIIQPDFSEALDLHNDWERVSNLLDGVEYDGGETDGRERYKFLCPVHEADGGHHTPSGRAFLDDHPAPGHYRLVLICQCDCSYEDIARALRRLAGEDPDGSAEYYPTHPPPRESESAEEFFRRQEAQRHQRRKQMMRTPEGYQQVLAEKDAEQRRWQEQQAQEASSGILPFPGGNGHDPSGGGGGSGGDRGSRSDGQTEDEGWTQAADSGSDALEVALEWWGLRCGVSPDDCRADPQMVYTACFYSGHCWLGFVVPGAPGKTRGPVIKWRIATDTPPTQQEKEQKSKRIWWQNVSQPEPCFIPPLPLESDGATTLLITEGEGDRTLAERAYRGDPDVLVTSLAGGAGTEVTSADMAEIHARGYRRLLLVTDLDSAGQKARKSLVRVIQDARVNLDAIPVDLGVLMPDSLQRGYKDLRDFRRLWTPPGEMYADPALVRAGIERAIQQAEAAEERIVPVYEQAYAARTLEKPWLVPDCLAPGAITFIGSRPGLGKTTVFMALFAAAREGGSWLGRHVEPHRLVFVTEEGQRSLWRKREQFGPMDHVKIHSLDFPPLPEDWGDTVRVIKGVARRFGAQAVLFDPVFSFFHVDDENSGAKVRPGLNLLRYFSDADIAVVGAFHNTKTNGLFAGSVAILGACEVALSLGPSPDQDPTHRSLVFERNRLNPDVVNTDKPLTVTMQDTEFVVLPSTPTAQQGLTLDLEHRVLLLLLKENPSGLRSGAWEQECGDADTIMRLAKDHPLYKLHTVTPLSRATFHRRRGDLITHGLVVYDTVGKLYSITQQGQDALRTIVTI